MNGVRPTPPRGLAAVRVALRGTTAGAPRGRRLVGLVALMALPVLVLALRVAFDDSGRGQGFAGFAWAVTQLYLRITLPLVLIAIGTGTFGEEWAGGTAHYVLPLPLPRGALVVGRWLSCVLRGLVLVLPSLVAVYLLATLSLGLALGDPLAVLTDSVGGLLAVLAVVSVLVGAYSALFVLAGLALKRAVTASLVYVFALEVLVANMPQSMASMSLAFHARNLLAHLTEGAAGQDLFRLITTDIIAVAPPSAGSSLLVLLAVLGSALALATFVLRRKEAGGESTAGDATA